MVKIATDGPFKKGDEVFCHMDCYTERGTVVDSWQIQDSWLVMVDHGEIEYAYAPYELSLIPKESDKVIQVNFKTKKRL